MLLFLGGGAIGALAGRSRLGPIALVQDILLVAWCWTVVNICHSAETCGSSCGVGLQRDRLGVICCSLGWRPVLRAHRADVEGSRTS